MKIKSMSFTIMAFLILSTTATNASPRQDASPIQFHHTYEIDRARIFSASIKWISRTFTSAKARITKKDAPSGIVICAVTKDPVKNVSMTLDYTMNILVTQEGDVTITIENINLTPNTGGDDIEKKIYDHFFSLSRDYDDFISEIR